MESYTIADFWVPRFNGIKRYDNIDLRGWSSLTSNVASFTEAPLENNHQFEDNENPEDADIILVSAPGAVGKTTLARQIAVQTGAIYVDLAEADAVGANSVSGGLAKSGLYQDWAAQETTVLIDGLDEARLRVTQDSFEAFLEDIKQIASTRKLPIVLFGRSGAVQDAFIFLIEDKLQISVLEIGFYPEAKAIDYAYALLRSLNEDDTHADTERQAVGLLVRKLRTETRHDGDRFAGYAPVLNAVAEYVRRTSNPQSIISDINSGMQPITIQSIVDDILNREKNKIRTVGFEDESLKDKLYHPGEQLERVSSKIFGLSDPDLPPMSPRDAELYSNALAEWVDEHPFLNGSKEPATSVFAAALFARSMKSKRFSELATDRVLAEQGSANPFLVEFYLPVHEPGSKMHIPAEHVGAIYASIRAKLSLGDSASLTVDGGELSDNAGDEIESLRSEVEITLDRRDQDLPRTLTLSSDQTGVLRLGSVVQDVDVMVPYSTVEVGPGSEAHFVSPVNIQCKEIKLTSRKVLVESFPENNASSVHLEAEIYAGAHISTVPKIRGTCDFSVSWRGSEAYPWTSFSTTPTEVHDPRVNEALRRFRRFVTAFRSHSKGSLKRYQPKIEHSRMTKGTGAAVLELLKREGILSLSGKMYTLNPEVLGEKAGVSYNDCMKRRFGDEAIGFVSKALS
ncbi:MAG: AAA family ATPase [Alphaproteobacteria bacterium]|nr:AAA family ATPase [Alphaproteobacteria bacterium]